MECGGKKLREIAKKKINKKYLMEKERGKASENELYAFNGNWE